MAPDEIFSRMTVHQLLILGTPSGEMSKAQALEKINRRRADKGLEPLDWIP